MWPPRSRAWRAARSRRTANTGGGRGPERRRQLAAPRGSFLARLCRYYLECLAHESGSGISIPAAASDVDYVVLNELPFARSGAAPGNERAMRKLIRKTRQERGQLALYVGYALRLRTSPRLEEEMRIEPVLIYPVEDTPESPAELLRPAERHSAVQSGGPQEPAHGGQRERDRRSDPALRRTGAGESRRRSAGVGRDHPAAAALPSGLGLEGGAQSVRALGRTGAGES